MGNRCACKSIPSSSEMSALSHESSYNGRAGNGKVWFGLEYRWNLLGAELPLCMADYKSLVCARVTMIYFYSEPNQHVSRIQGHFSNYIFCCHRYCHFRSLRSTSRKSRASFRFSSSHFTKLTVEEQSTLFELSGIFLTEWVCLGNA